MGIHKEAPTPGLTIIYLDNPLHFNLAKLLNFKWHRPVIVYETKQLFKCKFFAKIKLRSVNPFRNFSKTKLKKKSYFKWILKSYKCFSFIIYYQLKYYLTSLFYCFVFYCRHFLISLCHFGAQKKYFRLTWVIIIVIC